MAKHIIPALLVLCLYASQAQATQLPAPNWPKPPAAVKMSGTPSDLGSGTTYYVSASTGDDHNDGRSEKSPFKTVLPVNKIAMQPGDNILFKRGDTFINAHLAPKGSGDLTAGRWITIDAYGAGFNPLFKDGGKDKPGISLSNPETMKAYRIRNINMDHYLLGISSFKSFDSFFDGLSIQNCRFSNMTINTIFDVDKRGPEGAPLSWGMWLRFIKHVEITDVTTDNCDSPGEIVGSYVDINNFQAYNSAIQGLMLYSCENFADVDKVEGHITVRNSKFINTGRRSFNPGSCGILVQNTTECLIQDTEVAYTTNGGQAYDACGIDWEENNTNCVIDRCYVHDNDGQFLLQNDGKGTTHGNTIKNSLSINNGRRDITAQSTFYVSSDHYETHPKITIQNCIDVGLPGTVPYYYFTKTGSKEMMSELPASRFDVTDFTSTTADVGEAFDEQGLGRFSNTKGASVSNSHLALAKGAKIRTKFSGSDYIVNTYMKGAADLEFYSDKANGYVWAFAKGTITAKKRTGNSLTTLKMIAVPDLDPNRWFRVRIDASGAAIKTYIDERLVDTLADATYRTGSVGFNANGKATADELLVYKQANRKREVSVIDIQNGAPGGLFPFAGDMFKLEQNWTASDGIIDWLYKPYSVGYAEIAGPDAYIEKKDVEVDVTGGYNKVNVYMRNSTTSPKLSIEFSTDGGINWSSKTVDIRAMSKDGYPFNIMTPLWKNYVVDMSDTLAWKGTITGFRLRFGATSGSVGVGRVVISK